MGRMQLTGVGRDVGRVSGSISEGLSGRETEAVTYSKC